MRELIEFVARALVDDAAAVEVRELQAEPTLVYQLQVAPSDVGKVIGKHGRTAHSLRLLLSASAARAGRKAVLEIKE